jgi:hypothetical protein
MANKPSFSIKVTRRIAIGGIGLSVDQMRTVGLAMIDAQTLRWARGLDVNDQPAGELSRSFARRKLQAGKRGTPDLNFTGNMLAAYGILNAAPGRLTLGFSNDVSILKAYANHQRRNQLGISDSDARAVSPVVRDMYSENIRRAVVSLRAA